MTQKPDDAIHEMTEEELDEVEYALVMDDLIYERGAGYDLLVALQELCNRFCKDCPRNPDRTNEPCLGGDEGCPHQLEDAWDAINRAYGNDDED